MLRRAVIVTTLFCGIALATSQAEAYNFGDLWVINIGNPSTLIEVDIIQINNLVLIGDLRGGHGGFVPGVGRVIGDYIYWVDILGSIFIGRAGSIDDTWDGVVYNFGQGLPWAVDFVATRHP